MALHHSDLTASLKSSARPRRGILRDLESPRTTFNPDNACWSGFNPLCLGERVKNGLRGILQPPGPSSGSRKSPYESLSTLNQLEETFSRVSSRSSDARIYLAQTPFDAGPSTVVWASPKPAWGQWPCLSFSHCISVLTERDANAVYEVNTSESESESESDSESPLPPVYECTLDGVMHLWLIVPSRPNAGGVVQLSDEQMRAAVKFYDRSSLSIMGSGSAATNEKAVVDPYDRKREESEDAGNHHSYADARDAGARAGAVLLSCGDGNEVDAVALAVLLLTRHHSASHSLPTYSRGNERLRRLHLARGCGLGGHACHGVGSYTAYQASKFIDDDPRVSYIWKGLLGWQDVERVQAVLLSYTY